MILEVGRASTHGMSFVRESKHKTWQLSNIVTVAAAFRFKKKKKVAKKPISKQPHIHISTIS